MFHLPDSMSNSFYDLDYRFPHSDTIQPDPNPDHDTVNAQRYKLNNVDVLSGNTLGSVITNSSLTAVGTLSDLEVTGTSTLGTTNVGTSSANRNLVVEGSVNATNTNTQNLDVSGPTTMNALTIGTSQDNANLDVYGTVEAVDMTSSGSITCANFTSNNYGTFSNLQVNSNVYAGTASVQTNNLSCVSSLSTANGCTTTLDGPTTINSTPLLTNSLDLQGTGIYNVNSIDTANSGGDNLTFNSGGNGNYAFNTTADSSQTMKIKDNDTGDSECVVRIESRNSMATVDFIAATDGHAGIYHRANNNPTPANNYIHFGVDNTERFRIAEDEIVIPEGVILRPNGGIAGLHGTGQIQFSDVTDEDITVGNDTICLVVKNKPDTLRYIILPVPRSGATSNRRIEFVFLNEGSNTSAWNFKITNNATELKLYENSTLQSSVSSGPVSVETYWVAQEGPFTSSQEVWYLFRHQFA